MSTSNLLIGTLNLASCFTVAGVLEWLFPRPTNPDTSDGIMIEAVAGVFEICLFFILAPSVSIFINPIDFANTPIMTLIFSFGFFLMTGATEKVLYLWTQLQQRIHSSNSNPTNTNPSSCTTCE